MRTLLLVLSLGLSAFAAQDEKLICRDCHEQQGVGGRGVHTKDIATCKVCGSEGSGCCIRYCCDTREFQCAACGKQVRPDWPAGGAVVKGLQMSIKPATSEVKVGGAIDVIVKITNTTKEAWSLTNHEYSHGGFEEHVSWNATATGGLLSNASDVDTVCIQVLSHTEARGTESLAPGASRAFKVRIAEGRDSSGKKAAVTDKAGEITIRLEERVLGLASNEIKIVVAP